MSVLKESQVISKMLEFTLNQCEKQFNFTPKDVAEIHLNNDNMYVTLHTKEVIVINLN